MPDRATTTILCAVALAAPVTAKAADNEMEKAPAGEIIVTAQKRSERISKVPLSVDVLREVLGAIDFNNFAGFVNEPAIYGIELKKRF